ncbi:MAG: hemerythrin domain-containing protein [Bacteroidaceae bacterium]|nr:hemerythrin domain-containing protein [Bacteroidaceae bacterium]
MSLIYHEEDKLYDVIQDNSRVLQIMSRLGMPLGFGEKSVRQVCEDSGVDTVTFLALANYMKLGKEVVYYFIDKISVASFMDYLIRCHHYFHFFLLPYIRRLLVEAINYSEANKVAFLIIKSYDEYAEAVKRHTDLENTKIFPNVKLMVSGHPVQGFHISNFIRSHEGMDKKLTELRNIVIKYYNAPTSAHQEHLYAVLIQIFNLEADMRAHCELEDSLFVPAVQLIEEQLPENGNKMPVEVKEEMRESLSEREKDLVRCVAQGMSNKEIAAKLFITVNTVITHRKNITRKLNIHSPAGLTIYAIVNGLVSLDEVKNAI